MKVEVYYYHIIELGEGSGRVRTLDEFVENAWRFSVTYRTYPPEYPHTLVVVLMRGNPTDDDKAIWSGVPCRFEHRKRDGAEVWPTTVCQELSSRSDCDFAVTFVSRAYFHRPGWLRRFVEARERHGDGLYASMASLLGCPLQTNPAPNPHLRWSMTGFDPKTFNQYPHKIFTVQDEWRFESGDWNVSKWYAAQGKPVKMVTFDGEYSEAQWNVPRDTFCNGDQSNLLNWDRHTDAYKYGFAL